MKNSRIRTYEVGEQFNYGCSHYGKEKRDLMMRQLELLGYECEAGRSNFGNYYFTITGDENVVRR